MGTWLPFGAEKDLGEEGRGDGHHPSHALPIEAVTVMSEYPQDGGSVVAMISRIDASVLKVARPPDKSLVECASEVLLCWQTCPLVGISSKCSDYKNKHIHKSSQIPETKVIPPILFLNKYFL